MTPTQATQRREVFLAELAKTGLATTASRIAGLDRSELYKHRDRDPEFAQRWTEALDLYVDELEAEARRRAVAGTDKGVWHQGIQVGSEKQYSDSLLLAMLRAKRSKEYGDKSKMELSGPEGGPLQITESPTAIGRKIAFALATAMRAKEQEAAVEPDDYSDMV